MYFMLKWLYDSGKITAELLENAVVLEWIKEEERIKILS